MYFGSSSLQYAKEVLTQLIYKLLYKLGQDFSDIQYYPISDTNMNDRMDDEKMAFGQVDLMLKTALSKIQVTITINQGYIYIYMSAGEKTLPYEILVGQTMRLADHFQL